MRLYFSRSPTAEVPAQAEIQGQPAVYAPVVLHEQGVVESLRGDRHQLANGPAVRHPQQEIGESEAAVAAGLHRVRPLREGAAEGIVAVRLRVLAFVEVEDAPVHAGLQIVRAARMGDAGPRGPRIPRLVLDKRVADVGDAADIRDGALDELIDGESIQVRREAEVREVEALGQVRTAPPARG